MKSGVQPAAAPAKWLAAKLFIKQNKYHPKNVLLQAQHRILTGVPIPGNVRATVATDKGTRLRFWAAVKSSFVSPLPQFGQRALKNLIFGGRLRFMCDGRMTPTNPTQRPGARDAWIATSMPKPGSLRRMVGVWLITTCSNKQSADYRVEWHNQK